MPDRDWPPPGDDRPLTASVNPEVSFSPLYMVMMEVANERIAQRLEYGEAGDDTLDPAEWIARLAKHLGRAVTLEPAIFRRQLVRVAAICVAAIESFDRRFP
jgi:hypothetical protein